MKYKISFFIEFLRNFISLIRFYWHLKKHIKQ